jgi:hypothetical protein
VYEHRYGERPRHERRFINALISCFVLSLRFFKRLLGWVEVVHELEKLFTPALFTFIARRRRPDGEFKGRLQIAVTHTGRDLYRIGRAAHREGAALARAIFASFLARCTRSETGLEHASASR